MAKKLAKVFERHGWYFDRQKGSHMILKRAGARMSLSVPDHRVLDRGLLRKLIRDSGLSVDVFVTTLKSI